MINRRQWLCGMGVIAGAAAQPGMAFAASKEETQQTVSDSLSLAEFSPKSMLQVPAAVPQASVAWYTVPVS